jgi:glucosamine--fructose-6-phosphate aminotransferase (isomerizing)
VSLRDEIFEQAVALRRLLDRRREVEAIARAVRARRPRFVYLAARGTSDNACRYAQYVFGFRHRLPVALAAPSLFGVYGTPPLLDGALVVGVSQSGRSPDVVAVVEAGARQGAATLVITNEPGSPLASAAEFVLATGVGPETAVAASKTYTAQLLALAMLSAALDPAEEHWAALGRIPDAVARALAAEPAARAAAERHRALDACVVLGRGFHFATAHEWALKLKELARVAAEPYSPPDLEHGPIAFLHPGAPVLAVLARGPALDGTLRLLERLRQHDDAHLLVLSDDPAARALADAAFPIEGALPEWLTPIPAIVPAQLFALHLTLAKGLDPDAPRGLSKVTRTW